jgi:hypothetical protein
MRPWKRYLENNASSPRVSPRSVADTCVLRCSSCVAAARIEYCAGAARRRGSVYF